MDTLRWWYTTNERLKTVQIKETKGFKHQASAETCVRGVALPGSKTACDKVLPQVTQ